MPSSVSTLGDLAFSHCTNLQAAYFWGNAPARGNSAFEDTPATVYYLPGTTGWGPTYGGRPTALWVLPYPVILNSSSLGVEANAFSFLISWATNTSVIVEAHTDLATPAWSPISTNTLNAGSSYFSDPDWARYPGRVYRLRWP